MGKTAVIFTGQGNPPDLEAIANLTAIRSTTTSDVSAFQEEFSELFPQIKETVIDIVSKNPELMQYAKKIDFTNNIEEAASFFEKTYQFSKTTKVNLSPLGVQSLIVLQQLLTVQHLNQYTGGFFTPSVDFTTGHSLGVFSSLSLSNIVKPKDSLELAIQRANIVIKDEEINSREYKMAAIVGANINDVIQSCRISGAYISLINSENTYVIAGDSISMADAMNALVTLNTDYPNIRKESERDKIPTVRKGIKVIPLDISYPYHTDILNGAQEKFNKKVDEIFEKQYNSHVDIPFVSSSYHNSNGKINSEEEINVPYERYEISNPVDAKNLVLKRQLTSRVNFRETSKRMVQSGVTAVVEIGPGKKSALKPHFMKEAKKVGVEIDYHSINNSKRALEFAETYR